MQELFELRKEIRLLREQVRTDALTGLYNFRFFSDALPLEMERCRRSLQPLSMILLDIDHFKTFNDTWGHEVGNHALVLIANLISLTVRKLDFACRFGGEEFVVLLPNTELRQAKQVAERLREAIANAPLVHNGKTLSLTASLGVGVFRGGDTDTANNFIDRVDTLLYEAKRGGRNRVKSAPLELCPAASTVTSDEKETLFKMFDEGEN